VRGSVVTVVGAAELLGMPSELAGAVVPWLVVLRYREGRVGLAVDEVVDLTAIDATIPPIAIDAELDPLFDGAGRAAL
jgi:chemotaxis signal transduction protein